MTIIQQASELCLTPGRTQWKHFSWRGTFTFCHFLSSSFWKILLTLVLYYFFYSSHLHPSIFVLLFFLLLFHSLLAHFFSHGSVNVVLLFYSFLFHSPSWLFVPLSVVFWFVWSLSACSLLYCLFLCYQCSTAKTNPVGYFTLLKAIFYFSFPLAFTFLYDHVKQNVFWECCRYCGQCFTCLAKFLFRSYFLYFFLPSHPACTISPCAPFCQRMKVLVFFPPFFTFFCFHLSCPSVTHQSVGLWLSENVLLFSCSLTLFSPLLLIQKLHHFGVSVLFVPIQTSRLPWIFLPTVTVRES